MRSSCPIATRGGVRPTTMATPVIVASTRTVWGAVIVVRCGARRGLTFRTAAAAAARWRWRAIVHTPACRCRPLQGPRSSANTVDAVCDANTYVGLDLPSVDDASLITYSISRRRRRASCILYINCSPSSYVSDQLIK